MRRIAALMLALVMLTGCVQSVKLNERGVVQTIGIDLNEDGFYRVTLQVREAVGTSGAPNQPDESKEKYRCRGDRQDLDGGIYASLGDAGPSDVFGQCTDNCPGGENGYSGNRRHP